MADTLSPQRSAKPKPPAAEPPRLADRWDKFSHDSGRWLQDTFSREQIVSAVKTLLWVAPLTVLIWVYAEREQLTTDPGVAFPIDVHLSNNDRTVMLLEPREKIIIADLTGPRASIDQVKREIAPRADGPAVRIEIDQSLSTGQPHELQTAGQINSIFQQYGVTVSNCKPPLLRVFVDEKIELEISVRLPPDISNLEGAPVFDPPAVKVRGPKRSLANAEADGRLEVFADVAKLEALKTPGTHELKDVPLLYRFGDDAITINTSKVDATLRVKQSDETYDYPAMAVFEMISKDLSDKYAVEYNPILNNVTLVGPPDLINELKRPDSPRQPKAYFEVSRDDLPAGETRVKRARYDLPPGVSVAPKDAQREITFKLVDRGVLEQ